MCKTLLYHKSLPLELFGAGMTVPSGELALVVEQSVGCW